MRILLFVPSYNDSASAYSLSKKILENEHVERALIVDDSDDRESVEFLRSIDDSEIEIVRRTRSGKWSAWRLALVRSLEYDGLVEVDADVEVRDPGRLISEVEGYDVVTAYQDFASVSPRSFFSRRIAEIYGTMHRELEAASKFNMGGQIIAISKRAASMLIDLGFFEEPVLADDHTICLASCLLDLNYTTIDCGLRVRLPSKFSEWMRYRSRHRGTIRWVEDYVASKIGKRKAIREISSRDYRTTRCYFLKSLLWPPHPLNPAVLLFFAVSSILPIEDPFKWSALNSTKIRLLSNLLLFNRFP
ncbi:MAG: hypothetical protein PVJ38_06640 [Candidatus Bathyarchaeota archaeon]|jgi:hypothetical protein